jgi:hypothetical protein
MPKKDIFNSRNGKKQQGKFAPFFWRWHSKDEKRLSSQQET